MEGEKDEEHSDAWRGWTGGKMRGSIWKNSSETDDK